MRTWTFEELHDENEKNSLGLQYTIAEKERLKALWQIVSINNNSANADTVSAIMQELLITPAERFQDIFVLLLNGGKRNGFFVEFGACDGLFSSNTVTLERKFGWKGILAEPATFWHESLKRNRNVMIDTRCVSDMTGGTIELFQSEVPGNSSTHKDHPYLGDVRKSYTVETVSLLDLLKEHDAPKYIDFLSIDTEGHEKPVLEKFDFNQYKFGFICVEQHTQLSPHDYVRPILEKAGYRLIFAREEGRPVPMQITGVDEFYVPNNHPFAG